MRFARSASSKRHLLLDITPMVDVVFLIIIFFMTTAQFAQITRADIDLPRERGEQRDESEAAGLIVNLQRDGAIVINQSQFTLEELEDLVRSQLRAAGDDPTQFKLTIRADRSADSARLNDLLRLFESLGIGQAKLGTEVP